MLLTLHCRSLDRVEQCRKLWSAALKFFEAAVEIRAEAPQDGELLATHRALLIQLRETARDRV